jgi:hypothetical protein
MAALEALRQIPGEASGKAFAEVATSGSPDVRCAAIEALGERRQADVIPILAAAASDPDLRVQCAALESLGRIGDPAGLAAVNEAWEKGSERAKKAAVSAALSVANLACGKGDAATALPVYLQVLARATILADRIAALEGIGKSGIADTISQLDPYLQEKGAIREASLRACAAIADRMVTSGNKDQAVQVYLKCLDLSSGLLADMLVGRLRELGVAFASPRGFVTYWSVAGPFIGEGRAAWTETYPPEKGVDLGAEYAVGGRKLRWKGYATDMEGVLDLAALLTPNENAAAYCFSEFTVEREQDVYFKVGSDDGIRIWLNGKVLHDKMVDRGLTVDEDRVETRLQAGTNRLLLKVTNGGGAFNFCLRITDRTNRPVKFKMKTEAQ